MHTPATARPTGRRNRAIERGRQMTSKSSHARGGDGYSNLEQQWHRTGYSLLLTARRIGEMPCGFAQAGHWLIGALLDSRASPSGV